MKIRGSDVLWGYRHRLLPRKGLIWVRLPFVKLLAVAPRGTIIVIEGIARQWQDE